jgi:hypothetical protein
MTQSLLSTPYVIQSDNPTESSASIFNERSSVSRVRHAFLSCGTLAAVVQMAAASPTAVTKALIFVFLHSTVKRNPHFLTGNLFGEKATIPPLFLNENISV